MKKLLLVAAFMGTTNLMAREVTCNVYSDNGVPEGTVYYAINDQNVITEFGYETLDQNMELSYAKFHIESEREFSLDPDGREIGYEIFAHLNEDLNAGQMKFYRTYSGPMDIPYNVLEYVLEIACK